MLGSMTHFQGVLQDGNQLFDLSVVKHAMWYPPFSGQSLQQVYPFRPFAVLRYPHWSLVRFQWDWELVFGHEVKCTLGQAVIDLSEDIILLLNKQIRGDMWQLTLLGS